MRITVSDTTRLTMNFPTGLVKRVDDYASTIGLNRSSAVFVLLSQALDSQKAVTELGQLMNMIQDMQKKLDGVEKNGKLAKK